MATIGTFTKDAAGTFTGSIKTLILNLKQVSLRPVERTTESAPDFRVSAGTVEIGAAWKRTSKAERDYLFVKLDDPTFECPVFASLVDADEGYSLIWSRSRSAD